MAGFDLRKLTVFVVDDEAFTRETVARLLTSLGADNIVQAGDGEEALAFSWLIPAGGCVVISDLNMPRMTGLQLLKSIRMGQSGIDRAAPFVMLTAYSEMDLVDAALKLDVSAFLVKPVSRAALEKRLNHLARTEVDRSWLKSVDAYDAVDETVSHEPQAQPGLVGEPAPAGAVPSKKRSTASSAKPTGEENPEALAWGPSAASDAGADLLRELLADQKESAAAETLPSTEDTEAEIIARLSSLRGESVDPNLAKDIVAGIGRVMRDLGKTGTGQLLSALDPIERSGAVSLGDIALLLETDDDVSPDRSRPTVAARDTWPEELRGFDALSPGVVSTQNIVTRDGNILIASGTELTGTLIGMIRHLDKIGVLDVTGDGPSVLRVAVPPEEVPTPTPAAPPIAAPKAAHRAPTPRRPRREHAIGPTEIKAGAVVSRDIHTDNGTLYLAAGTTLSDRLVNLLDGLYEARKLTRKIWVVD